MKKYIASFSFLCPEKEKIIRLWKWAIENINFTPRYMSIYISEDFFLDEIDYNYLDMMNYLMSEDVGSIHILNSLDTDDNFAWLKLKTSAIFNFCEISWYDGKFDFLIKNESFKEFICIPEFINGACYDSHDVFSQSNNNLNYQERNNPQIKWKVIKDPMGFAVADISQNWGREISFYNLNFLVAPLMWFGKLFFQIVRKDILLASGYVYTISFNEIEVLNLVLFDLYNQDIDSLRKEQKRLWLLWDLDKNANDYKKILDKSVGWI